MSSLPPYLSIVLVGRNDNYGGDFNERLHNALMWLTNLVETYKLHTELILVDYNPIAENPSLQNMLSWPQGRNYLTIRLLHVPQEIHQRLINPQIRKTVPVFEFNAKNMAIRRAKGEYTLSTNADILFHPAIIEFIAKKNLSKEYYYRTDRYDYTKINHYDFNNTVATLSEMREKVVRLMLKGYAYDVNGEGNFMEESLIRFKNWRRLFLDLHLIKIHSITDRWQIDTNHDGFIMRYHTHCSGDFMLMHRDHWFRLRGYPEDTFISTHCDALLTVMSAVLGLKENILRWPIYHQDHQRRYNTDFDKRKDDQEINDMFERLLNDSREMIALQQPKITNAPDWGFANENFTETVI